MYMKSELIHPSLIFATSVILFAVDTTLFVYPQRDEAALVYLLVL